jgi:hypothetical protein
MGGCPFIPQKILLEMFNLDHGESIFNKNNSIVILKSPWKLPTPPQTYSMSIYDQIRQQII